MADFVPDENVPGQFPPSVDQQIERMPDEQFEKMLEVFRQFFRGENTDIFNQIVRRR